MRPVTVDAVADYLAGELSDEAAFEEALFADPGPLPAEVALVSELLAEMRYLARRGTFGPVLLPRELEALRGSGLRVREGVLEPGGRLIADRLLEGEWDVLITRFPVDLTGVRRVDIELHRESDGAATKPLQDVPFEPGSGEVVMACERRLVDVLLDVYGAGLTYRLVGHGENAGDLRVLGEFRAGWGG